MKQLTVWLFLILSVGLTFLPAVAGATAPGASFTSNLTSGGIPTSVQFIDTSTNAPNSWLWTFGDGGTSTYQYPVNTYTAAGTYTVTLTVTNADGYNTLTKTGYVTVSKSATAPVALFTSNITTGSQPLAVQFLDSSSNSPSAWAWSFGDGGTSAVQNPVHTYTSAGTYTVTLSAVNSAGSATVSKGSYITVASSALAPMASFTSTKTSGTTPLTIQFVDTTTNSPTSWVWSFGDGSTSTSQNPSHTYVNAGTYTVTLTATNTGGSSTDSMANYITAAMTMPVASFKANATSGTPPLDVQFTDTSLNTPTSWAWSFGDSATSTVQNPVHEYNSAGTYTVSFTATNSVGSNTTSIANYINITAIPVPVTSFNASIMSGSAPLTVQFGDTSMNSPTYWDWSFGDGSTSSLQNPAHTYTSAGSYSVTLTATNAGGSRTVTTSHLILVSSPVSSVATAEGTPVATGTTPVTAEPTASITVTPTESAQGDSSGTFVIIAIIVLLGIGAIAFILMKRPPRGPSHSHRREL